MNRDVVGAVAGAYTVLSDREELAAAEYERDVGVVAAGLFGVPRDLRVNIGVEGPRDPRGKRICSGECHFACS